MATEPKLNPISASLAANAVVNTLSSGYLHIYSGSVPTTGSSSGGTLLSISVLGTTAASTAASGICTFNTIATTTAFNTGTASFFRVYGSTGGTTGLSSGGVFQGTVDPTAGDLVFNSVAFSSGATVSITSFTYTQRTS